MLQEKPTDKQINYFTALVRDKELTEQQRTALMSTIASANKRSMMASIQWLVGLSWKKYEPIIRQVPVAPVQKIKVEQGYYAIVGPQADTLKFYQVRVPDKGKWVGYTFVAEVSGENHLSVRDKQTRDAILAEIAKEPTEALKRFGKEIGRCGHCRKQLTDAVSREFGIGPVCRKELGL